MIVQLFSGSLSRKPLGVQLYKQLWPGLLLCGADGQRTGTMKVWSKREMKRRNKGWTESGGGELDRRETLD